MKKFFSYFLISLIGVSVAGFCDTPYSNVGAGLKDTSGSSSSSSSQTPNYYPQTTSTPSSQNYTQFREIQFTEDQRPQASIDHGQRSGSHQANDSLRFNASPQNYNYPVPDTQYTQTQKAPFTYQSAYPTVQDARFSPSQVQASPQSYSYQDPNVQYTQATAYPYQNAYPAVQDARFSPSQVQASPQRYSYQDPNVQYTEVQRAPSYQDGYGPFETAEFTGTYQTNPNFQVEQQRPQPQIEYYQQQPLNYSQPMNSSLQQRQAPQVTELAWQ